MTYMVKECFYSLQGEGFHSGRPAVFLRFAGCNLWTGREEDRATAICAFCDTDFVGIGPDGGRFESATALAELVGARWPGGRERTGDDAAGHGALDDERGGRRFVVCTGGEPLLQLDEPAIHALHARGFEVAVETNGTLLAPRGIDWICVSPKAGARLVQRRGNEIKLVFPQAGAEPAHYEQFDFDHFFLQPMDGPALSHNTQLASAHCLAHPRWHLSLQTHKVLGLR